MSALPDGFVLDQPTPARPAAGALPEGFVVDQKPPVTMGPGLPRDVGVSAPEPTAAQFATDNAAIDARKAAAVPGNGQPTAADILRAHVHDIVTARDAAREDVGPMSPRDEALRSGGGFLGGGGFRNTLNSSAIANFGDEVGAAGLTAGDFLHSLTSGDKFAGWGAAYDKNLNAERSALSSYAQTHPSEATAANLLGGFVGMRPGVLTTAPAAVPPPAGGIKGWLQNTATAAGLGGVAGFGAGEDGFSNRAYDAVKGAGIGALAGGGPSAVNAGWSMLADRVRNVFGMSDAGQAGLTKLLQAFERDGVTPQQAMDRLTQWQQDGGKPAMLFDLGGENVRALARQVASTPGTSRDLAVNALTARDEAAPDRIIGDIKELFSPNTDFHGTLKALDQSRKTAAQPAYKTFYESPPMNPDLIAPGGDLDKLMSRPAMRGAAKQALDIIAEEGGRPASLGITFNEAGDPVFEKVPSWKTMDYLKRGLDDVVEANRNDFGKLVLNNKTGAINKTRAEFIDLMDRESGDTYKAARSAYAGPSVLMDAMRLGRDVFKHDAELTVDHIAKLNTSEREFFQAGVVRAIQDRLDNTPGGADEVRRFFGTPALQKRLEAAFDNPEQFAAFKRRVDHEISIRKGTAFVSPNTGSQTQLRGTDAADFAMDPRLNYLAGVAHDWRNSNSLWNFVPKLYDRSAAAGTIPNEAAAGALAPVLFNTQPLENTVSLYGLLNEGRRTAEQAARGGYLQSALGKGAALGGASGLLSRRQ